MQKKQLCSSDIKKITVFVVLMFLLSILFQVNSVMAHAALVKSDPPRRATLTLPPKHIQLWFNEKIEGAYASVTIKDSQHNVVTTNSPESIVDDPKSIVLNLPQLEPGRYTVHYRVMSVDGHVIESNFDFNVKK
ncbi:copper resistance CopC family protein [Nitrosomonas sp.]|uniref:copper resistance CopC family protein n=1 Tax=Nitrosomonas sp. TaxID=42353 RepID=UPI001DBFC1C5|nr:copper resistance CopC family protein [Nitrosomonas sp.]MBX3616453.1 copper resistance protein CopC [Nitrosomonas sp.]